VISKTVFKELAQFFVLGKQWFVAAFVAVSLIGCEVVEEPLNTNFEIRLEPLQQREGDEGNIRVGDQFEIAVYNTETGQKDSSAALSDDNQSFQADEYTWTLTEQSVAALELEQGYDNTLSVSLVGEVTIEAKNSQNTASLTIEISPALLQSVEIQRDTDSFIWGLEKQLQLLGNFSDGTTQLLTENVDWSVSNEEITSITSTGLVSGNAVGQVTVEAVVINEIQQNIADAFELNVTAAAVKQLTISGSNDLPQGRNSQLTVIATYTNDTTANLSDSALWATDSSSVSLSSSGVATALELGSANISASIDNGYGTRIDSNSHPLTISDAVIESLSVIPNPGDEYFEEYSVAIERSRAFVVNARYSNGIEQDITSNSGLSLTSNDESALNVVKGVNVYTLSGITVSDSSVIASITNRVNETISVTQDISIYKPLLIQLSLTSSSSTQILGNTVQYSVFGTYHDGSNGAITENINWSLSNSALASISASGSLSTLGVGDLTVTAVVLNDSEQEINDEIELTITPAAITKIELVGSDDIALGRELQIQANATYTDGTTQDLASSVTWQLSDDTLAAISETGLLTTSALGNLQLTGSIDDGYGNTISSSALSIQVSEKVIESLSIKATNEAVKTNPLTIAIEKTEPFIVEATYSNKDIEDITAREALTVSSSNTEFAEIKKSEAGTEYNVSTLTVGATTLTASINNRLGTTITESVVLNVNKPLLVGIEITPVVEQYALGLTTDWRATGVFEDETRDDITESVTWSSSDSAVAAFNNDSDTSILTSITIGNISISASLVNDFGDEITSEFYEVATTRALLTGISLQPQDTNMWQEQKLSLPQGASTSLLVVGSFTDGTSANVTDVSWSLGNESLASLDTTDNLFTLTGSTGDGNKGGTTLKATATEGESTFESEIDVTVIDPKLESFAITLPEENGLWQGYQQSYVATGTFSDSSTQNITSNVVWSIPDEYKSNISFAGNSKILLNAQGSAGIEAEYTDANYSDQVTSESISFSIAGALLESITINTYLDSNKDRVKDSDSDAVINEIAKGQYAIVTATGSYSDGTTNDLTSQVTWTSSDDTAFSIDSDGKGTTLNSSDTDITITASFDNDAAQTITSTYTLTATPAIVQSVDIVATIGGSTVVPSDVPAGENIQLQVRGYYSDNTRQILSGSSVATWATSNAEVATVDSATGLVTMVGTSGNFVNITATETVSGNSYSDSITLDVADAIIKSMKITPDTSTDPWNIALGSQYQMKAYAVYSDSSEQEITTDSGTGWSVPDAGHQTYISVNNSDIKGLVTGESEIDTAVTVQATSVDSEGNAISATADVIVGAPILELIEISPTNTSMIEGDVLTFTATGYTSDDRFLELSDTVTWSTSDSAIAEFNQTNDYDLFAKTSGTVEVIASYVPPGQEEISTTTRVTIDPATLRSIAITPTAERYTSTPSPKPLFLKGSQDLLTATGTYSNGSTKKINGQVTWDSTAPSVATISSVGLLTPVSEGETTISATIDIEELGSTKTVYIEYSIVVQGPLLEYIEIAPLSPTTTMGLPIQFSATGFYSDDTSKTLTDEVTWQVGRTGDDPSTLIGSMTSGAGVGGVFTPSKNGFGPISASINDFDGKAVSKQTFVTIDDIASLSISNTKSTIYAGQSDTFTVKGTTTGGKELTFTQGLSWSVTGNGALNDSGEASSNALVTSSAQGSMTITATWTNQDASTVSTSSTVTIENPLLTALTVTNANSSVKEGRTSQLTATATYSDGSTSNVSGTVTWFSDNTNVASIDANGLISTSDVGSASIYASFLNAAGSTIKSGNLTFSVEDAVLSSLSVNNANVSISKGTSSTLTASGTMSNGTSQLPTPVTWTSSDTSIVTVGQTNGVITAVSQGTATITASAKEAIGSDVEATPATSAVTVTDPVLSSLSIDAVDGAIPRGTSQTLSLTGLLSDDTTADVSALTITWSVVNGATNMSVNASTGEVSVLNTATVNGTATIRATDSGTSVSTDAILTVGSGVVDSIDITTAPNDGIYFDVSRGTTSTLASSIVMSDGSAIENKYWRTSNSAAVTVSSSGVVKAVSSAVVGQSAMITLASTNDTFTQSQCSASSACDYLYVRVSSPTLTQVKVTGDTSVPRGKTASYTAQGLYTDAPSTWKTISSSVTWASDDTTNMPIDSSSGVLTMNNSATLADTVIITATVNGINSPDFSVTVGNPELTAIEFKDGGAALSSLTLGKGQTNIDLSSYLVATYTDNTTTLPTDLSWTSGNTASATVNNTTGSVDIPNSATLNSSSSISVLSTGTPSANDALDIVVSDPVLESLAIPATVTIPVGTSDTISVTAALSDGSSSLLTTPAWGSVPSYAESVTSDNILEIKSTANPGDTFTLDISAAKASFLAGESVTSNSMTVTVGDPILSTLSIDDGNVVIGKGDTLDLSLSGTLTDTSNADMNDLTFSATSSNESTATVSVDNGTKTITVTMLSSATETTSKSTITVEAYKTDDSSQTKATASIVVTAGQAVLESITLNAKSTDNNSTLTGDSGTPIEIPKGTSRQINYTATLTDSSGVIDSDNIESWLVYDTGTDASLSVTEASVNATGLVDVKSTATVGETFYIEITANESDISTTKVTDRIYFEVVNPIVESISIDSYDNTVGLGETRELQVTATLTDGTTTTSPSGVTFSWTDQGLGNANIDETQTDTTSTVTVDASTATVGQTEIITAQVVGNPVAVSSAQTTVTVASADVKTVNISSPTASVAVGKSIQFSVSSIVLTDDTSKVSESDFPSAVIWEASDNTVVDGSTFSSDGLLKIKTTASPGSVDITGKMLKTAGDISSGYITSTAITVTITAADVTSISITNGTSEIPLGTTLDLTVEKTFSDNSSSSADQTGITWSCNPSPCTKVSVDSDGIVSTLGGAVADDTEVIRATLDSDNSITADFTVTLKEPLLTGLSITQGDSRVHIGESIDLEVTGTLSDGSATILTTLEWSDVTGDANFTVNSSTGVVEVTNSASDNDAITVKVRAETTTGSASYIEDTVVITATVPYITSISFSPSGAQTVPVGTTLDIVATATKSDGSTISAEDLRNNDTNPYTWTVTEEDDSATTDATISIINQGSSNELTRVDVDENASTSTNTFKVTATIPEKNGSATTVSQSTVITVGTKVVEVSLTASATEVALGKLITVTPRFNYSDDAATEITQTVDGDPLTKDELTWSATDISPTASVVKFDTTTTPVSVEAVRYDGDTPANNSTTITAQMTVDSHTVTGSVDITVLNKVIESMKIYAKGDNAVGESIDIELVPVAVYSDKSTALYPNVLDWETANPGELNFDSLGTPTPNTVTDHSGSLYVVTPNATVADSATVNSAITVTDNTVTPNVVGNYTLSIINGVTKSEIQNSESLANAVRSSTYQLSSYLILDNKQMLDISAYASLWSTTAPSDANTSVNATGNVTLGSSALSGTVTADDGSRSDNTTFTVERGKNDNDSTALSSVEIYPRDPVIRRGKSVNVKVYGTYTFDDDPSGTGYMTVEITNQVKWITSDDTVVTSAAEALKLGSATLRAYIDDDSSDTYDVGEKTDTVTVSVVDSDSGQSDYLTGITLEGVPSIISDFGATEFARRYQIKAYANFNSGFKYDITEDVYWTTTDSAIATISNAPTEKGLLTPVLSAAHDSTVKVTAQWFTDSGMESVESANITLTDVGADPKHTLDSIAITYTDTAGLLVTGTSGTEDFEMPVGWHANLIATASFTKPDTTTYSIDVTDQVTWTSAERENIEVSNAPGLKGRITSLTADTSVGITATMPGTAQSDTYYVETISASLTAITVSPDTQTIANGSTYQFTATGTFDNSADIIDITSDVVWVSSDPTKVIISNAKETRGLATRIAAGDVTISAYYRSETDSSGTID
jgi:hypothetical protein